MKHLASACALLLLVIACGEPDVQLTFEHPRLRLDGTGQADRVVLRVLRESEGRLAPVDGFDPLVRDCPCDGRTVDVAVPSDLGSALIVGLALNAQGQVIARAARALPDTRGVHALPFAPLECNDADLDGFCDNEAAPFWDCDDTSTAFGPAADECSPVLEDADVSPPDILVEDDTRDVDDPAEVDPIDVQDVALDGLDGLDADTFTPPGKGPYESCEQSAECSSGWCLPTRDGKQCSPKCTGGCAPGFFCDATADPNDGDTSICYPHFLRLCDPCKSDADCIGFVPTSFDNAKCLATPDGAGSFCGGDCAELGCPEGFKCTLEKQCVPNEGACECSQLAKEAALWTDCAHTNGNGTCAGTRTCAVDGLTDCDAQTPAPEVCGGSDEDCDGAIDEDIVCDKETCASDPIAAAGADPCMDVVGEGSLCALVPREECFGAVEYVDTVLGCRRYRLGNQPLGPDWCRVPAGSGIVGHAGGIPHGPMHLSAEPTYFIMRTELTESLVFDFSEDYVSAFPDGTFNCDGAQPPQWVSPSFAEDNPDLASRYLCWTGARELCQWLGGDLPTEAQWERAARGLNADDFPWGVDAPDTSLAVFGSDEPALVGTLPAGASPFGLLDTAGNVAEWTRDAFDAQAYCVATGQNPGCELPGPVIPVGPLGVNDNCNEAAKCYVVRGGSYDTDEPTELATWARMQMTGQASAAVGGRCVVEAAKPPAGPPGCCPVAPVELSSGEGVASSPSVAVGPTGQLAVLTLEPEPAEGNGAPVALSTLSATGQPIGEPTLLASLDPSLDGKHAHALAWTGDELRVAYEENGDVKLRRFTLAGVPIGVTQLVNDGPYKASFSGRDGLALWADGQAAVCTSPGARVAVFAPDLTPVNAGSAPVTPNEQTGCALAVLSNGQLVATYLEATGTLHGRLFDGSGVAQGEPFQVGLAVGGKAKDSNLLGGSVAALSGDRYAIVFAQNGPGIFLEVRSGSAAVYSTFSVTDQGGASAPLAIAGNGPWLDVVWTSAGLPYRSSVYVPPAGEPVTLAAPDTVANEAGSPPSYVGRDIFQRLVLARDGAQGKGQLWIVTP